MSFEERMEQLGRRAVEQEPPELALPRCIRAAECVKPVSCVKYRVQRHGFGEGRLPIPGITIRDKDERSDASHWQQQQERDSPTKKPAHKSAGKLLRPSQQQAQQQVDAIKARKSAAKAFSASLERRNAELRQHSSKDAATQPAHTPPNNPTATMAREVFVSQPKVERHIKPKAQEPVMMPAAGSGSATATTPCSLLPTTHTAAPPAAYPQPTTVDSSQQEQEEQQQHTRSSLVEGTAAVVAAPQHPPSNLFPDTATQAYAAKSHLSHALQDRTGQGCTFLTAPGSPWRIGAAVPPPLLDAAAVAGAVHSTMYPSEACAAGAATAAAADVQSASAADVAGSSSVHVQQSCASVDASSKLLCYARSEAGGVPTAAAAGSQRGRTPGREGTVPTATGATNSSSVAASAGHGGNNDLWSCNSTSSGAQRPVSPLQRVGSPTRRPGSPHWSPVPPKAQLQSPVVVRPMCQWVCEHEPMQQVPPAPQLQWPGSQQQQQQMVPEQREPVISAAVPQPQQRQQQPPVSPLLSTVHGSFSASAASTAAVTVGAAAGPLASSCSVRRVSAGRVSVRGDGLGLRKPRGSTGGSRSSSAPVAAFSSPELALLAAAAAEKVAVQQLVLPALCSCGHDTSVLDATYPNHCCSNCPLRRNAALYEQLLTGLLAGMTLN